MAMRKLEAAGSVTNVGLACILRYCSETGLWMVLVPSYPCILICTALPTSKLDRNHAYKPQKNIARPRQSRYIISHALL